MPDELKRKSDQKSMELFGKTNEEHHHEIMEAGNAKQKERKFHIDISQIHGFGVFASNDLSAGDNIGLAVGKIKNTGDPDLDYKRTELGRYINHSNNPNCKSEKKDNKYFVIALKKIKKNDELTVNYDLFYADIEK